MIRRANHDDMEALAQQRDEALAQREALATALREAVDYIRRRNEYMKAEDQHAIRHWQALLAEAGR